MREMEIEKEHWSMKKTLPTEMIREILLRLPVRHVLRCKCVCKSWLSLISDPQFGISHYDLAAAPSYRLLLKSNGIYFQSIDIDEPPPPPSRNSITFDYYADFHDRLEVLGSSRGLILLYYKRRSDLILWNPSIGVHKRLSSFPYDLSDDVIHPFAYGFAYEASADDYLLVLISLCRYEHGTDAFNARFCVFHFKTHSWDVDHVYESYEDIGYKFRAGSLVNGALHWLAYSVDRKVPVILAFDLIHKSLFEIPLLGRLTREPSEICSLSVIGGCLCVCCSFLNMATTELWVMKEYTVQSSWSKFIVIPTDGIHKCFSPICITKDGGIFGTNMYEKLEKFNDKGELLEQLTYGVIQELYHSNLQSAWYRESLLLLPSVIRKTSDDEQL